MDKTEADAIQPCPFCGGKADDIGGNEVYITCKKCIVGNTVYIENWNNAARLISEDETDNEIAKRVLRKLLAENGWAWIQTWLAKEK